MPNTKEDFKWTDELVEKFMDYFKNDFSKGFPKWQAIQYFKNSIQSKQPILEYEIITVREINNKDNIIECKYRGMFNPDYYEIHSVKRISDLEVFTIGDKALSSLKKEFEITGFEIATDGKMHVLYEVTLDSGKKDNWRLCYLHQLKKIKKQPLFTIEQENEIISIIKRFI